MITHNAWGVIGPIFVYALSINAVAYLTYGLDKNQARVGGRRISENTLLLLALVGGSAGAMVACHRLRHKTRKEPFRTVLLVILGGQIGAIGFELFHWGLPLIIVQVGR